MSTKYLPLIVLTACLGVGLAAMAGFAWGNDDPAPKAPRATADATTETDRIAAELAELRARSAATQQELETLDGHVTTVAEHRRAAGEAVAPPAPKPRKKNRRPTTRRRPKPKPQPTSGHRKIIWDDNGPEGPLKGIKD